MADQALGRRIILLLDGTWNDSDFGPFDTNIVRLRGLIASDSDAADIKPPYEKVAASAPANMVTKPVSNARPNIVFYERGVGTGTLIDRLFGGAIGTGLEDNIRRAYKFLSFVDGVHNTTAQLHIHHQHDLRQVCVTNELAAFLVSLYLF